MIEGVEDEGLEPALNTEWWKTLYERQHQIWPVWAESDGDSQAEAEFVLAISVRTGAGMALDLGCGSGRLACAIAEHGWHVHGMDISPALIERAQRRAEAKGLTSQLRFDATDFRSSRFETQYDLMIFWDSVLSIWPFAETQMILRDVHDSLTSGGVLVLQQLNPDFFLAESPIEIVVENASVGPGRTERRYDFDPDSGVLSDQVVYTAANGARESLPAQSLHLAKASEISEFCHSLHLSDVRGIGSEGWAWKSLDTPVTAQSPQFVVVGWHQ